MSRQSIRKKLFLLLAIMGMIPFLIITVYDGVRMVDEMERHAIADSWYRNTIVCNHLASILSKDFAVLQTLADNPYFRQYVTAPTPEGEAAIRAMLRQAIISSQEDSAIAITAASGQQMLRTDTARPVNISMRPHFQKAMEGTANISDVIQSMATGSRIIVLAVPIPDAGGKPVGVIQRNFDLSSVQSFVRKYADENTAILATDQDQNILAHSDWNLLSEEERNMANEAYGEIRKAGGIHGVSRITMKGEDYLVSYARIDTMGLGVYTVHPYWTIWKQANAEVFKRAILGLSLILLMGFVAYWLARRATRPIQAIAQIALKIANGEANIDKLKGFSDDEIGQVAHALNELQSARAAFQRERERDPLTQIANSTAIEAFCRRKLKEYDEAETPGLTALYLIDLDHFKEANASLGREQGDRLLEEFAHGLKGIFRLTDCVGRMNDDKFVAIADGLPGTKIVERLADSINRLARELTVDGDGAEISASVGIAIVPRHGKTYNHLLHAARLALAHTKSHGRNGYHISSETDEEEAYSSLQQV